MSVFSLSQVRTGRQARPPKIVIYGPPKVGKSTFSAGIPNAIFLPTEEGIDALDVASFPRATSFSDVLGAIGALAKETHEYRALVLDSLDWTEPLIWADICREHNAPSIEQVGGGYGKGYVEALKHWKRLLDGLDYLREHKAMTIVLIGHDEIRRMEPPDSEPYDYAALKLHKRAAALVTEWADVIGYAHLRRVLRSTDTGFGSKHVRAVSTDEHELVVGANPAYVSGSRFPLPDVVPLTWDAFRSALVAAIQPAAE
jgi:hypothetical protein